ncbi:hypothetical protein CJ195_11105 [Bacillus sp. UMB0899]|nr:hypothetical protein CJ195_11105 [Bacillus sp. UMB0899]
MEDLQKLKQKYQRAMIIINHQKVELKNANDLILKLKDENQDLMEYKNAYYSLKTAGVSLPYVRD